MDASLSIGNQTHGTHAIAALGVQPNLDSQDPNWLLVEEGFTLRREHEIESLFAIANGYVAARGSLAEGCALSAPATFVAGVFKQAQDSVPELMILPDLMGVRIWIDGQSLNMERGEILEHRRTLDLRRALLWREWRHRDPDGRITRIVSLHLVSLRDRHLLLQCVTFTAENYSSVVRFQTSIELAEGVVPRSTEAWKLQSNSVSPTVLSFEVRPAGRDTTVNFGISTQIFSSGRAVGKRTVETSNKRITENQEIGIETGSELQLNRLISIFSSREVTRPFEYTMAHLKRIVEVGVAVPTSAHVSEWRSRWHAADVEIEGDDSLQKALRFATYHLIGAANSEDAHVSIGARALTGPAYKGHVFWDTEIYMLPFYIFTHPPSARALLEYRYHTLDAARAKARKFGFQGAMYPWESADTGEEVTPPLVIAPNGEVLKVCNGEMEIHITADIAFGVWQYWEATQDDDFFVQFGAEIMLESARFWASRGRIESDGNYHIRHVIGPDEYHEDIDDSSYTNLMAAWNLRHGVETANLLQQRWPEKWSELQRRVQISEEEVSTWPMLADAMYTGFDKQTLLFEEFSGYYQTQPVNLKDYEPRTAAMDIILGHDRIQHTNVVKQADVVLATFLLWNEISPDARAANFRYYDARTGHGSSLSPAMHALIAARIGEYRLAGHYLKQAAEIDLCNNMGNAAGGVHAAALGGLWQAFVFGFGGLETRANEVSFAPHLPTEWRRLAFVFQWHGSTVRVEVEPTVVRAVVTGPGPLKLHLEGGFDIDAQPQREYIAERADVGWKRWAIAHSNS